MSDGEGRVTELPFASARGLVAAHGPLAPSTGDAAAARAMGSAPVALVAAAAAATQEPPPPGGLAPAPAAPHVSPPPLDRLLRFTGDAAGSAKEEAAFLLYGARTHRALRVTFLAFFCIAYGAYALVGLSDALTKAEGFSALYFIRVGQCVAFLFPLTVLFLVNGSVRGWLVLSAVYAAVLTNVFGTCYFASQAPGAQMAASFSSAPCRSFVASPFGLIGACTQRFTSHARSCNCRASAQLQFLLWYLRPASAQWRAMSSSATRGSTL